MPRSVTPLKRIKYGAIALSSCFLIAVVGYRFMGDYDWLESVWMVVITISTVGFSENSQTSPFVQLLTIFLILFGVSAAAYTCGGFIQLALQGEFEKLFGNKKMTREISKLRHHIIICGFGRLGKDLAAQLNHRNELFVIIDCDADKYAQAVESDLLAVYGDATDEVTLNDAGLVHAKAIVSALPSDAENVFIALTARNLHPEIMILAKAEHDSSCRKLRQAGANKIVMPHRAGAQKMERMISRPSTADLVELFAEASNLDMELDEIRVPSTSSLIGKSLAESGIKSQFQVLVIGTMSKDQKFQLNPELDYQLNEHDTLIVVGKVENINQMKAQLR